VDLYLSGHDHSLQHLNFTADPTMAHLQELMLNASQLSLDMFVVGNVAYSDGLTEHDLLVFGKVDPGFLFSSIDGDIMTHTI